MAIITGQTKSGSGITTYRKVTAKQVVSTVTETDLLNGEITVAGGVLAANGFLRFSAWGDWLQNASATLAPQFQFKLGPSHTVIFNWTPFNSLMSMSNSTNRWPWSVDIMINAANATNSQTMRLRSALAGVYSNATATNANLTLNAGEGGQSALGTASTYGTCWVDGYNVATIDTTAAMAIQLTVVNGASSASYDTTLRGALVEIL